MDDGHKTPLRARAVQRPPPGAVPIADVALPALLLALPLLQLRPHGGQPRHRAHLLLHLRGPALQHRGGRDLKGGADIHHRAVHGRGGHDLGAARHIRREAGLLSGAVQPDVRREDIHTGGHAGGASVPGRVLSGVRGALLLHRGLRQGRNHCQILLVLVVPGPVHVRNGLRRSHPGSHHAQPAGIKRDRRHALHLHLPLRRLQHHR
mmetsp:Transcript_9096/g.20043  ORF Transcript_9096/g.20043 Transcript_9096/m.20043 type:complete len:207 (+) Transcript_9096:84-704(+)